MRRQNARILHSIKFTGAKCGRTKLKSLYCSKILPRKTCLGIFLMPFCCIPLFWLLALFYCVLWFSLTSDMLTVHILLLLETNVLLEISPWVFLVIFGWLVSFFPVFLFAPLLEVPPIFDSTYLDSPMVFKGTSSILYLVMATYIKLNYGWCQRAIQDLKMQLWIL